MECGVDGALEQCVHACAHTCVCVCVHTIFKLQYRTMHSYRIGENNKKKEKGALDEADQREREMDSRRQQKAGMRGILEKG